MIAFMNSVLEAPNVVVVEVDVDVAIIGEFLELLDEQVLAGRFNCTQPN